MREVEDRVSRLEAALEGIREDVRNIHARLNSMENRTTTMWVTTILAVLSVWAAVLLKG